MSLMAVTEIDLLHNNSCLCLFWDVCVLMSLFNPVAEIKGSELVLQVVELQGKQIQIHLPFLIVLCHHFYFGPKYSYKLYRRHCINEQEVCF